MVSRDADGLAEAPRRAGDVGDLEEAPRRGARWPGGGAVQGRLAAWLRRRAHSAVAGGGGHPRGGRQRQCPDPCAGTHSGGFSLG